MSNVSQVVNLGYISSQK